MMNTARNVHALLHLLDRQVVRSDNGNLVCKVDDLEMDYDDTGRPYVTAILTGPLALGPRLGGLAGWLMIKTTQLFRPEEDPGPQRIPMELVSEIGSALKVADDPQEPALERWVRANLIAPIPGSGIPEGEEAERRPARAGEGVGELRLGPMIRRTVVGASGAELGQVADVRLTQDGPLLGHVQNAFAVAGFIVTPRHTGQLFGYERTMNDLGPALVRALIRRIHRENRYATWDQVDELGEDAIRLSVDADQLRPLSAV